MFDETGKKDQENAFQDWTSRAVFAARKRFLSHLCTNNEIPKKKKLATVPHPPYSSDLAPFLFPKLKEILKGRTFSNQKELKGEVTSAVNQLSKNGFLFVSQQWLARLKKCIECN
ncbi:hypothetical protein BV898_02574 [Hypsibius exemplaris]|uniref:Tc1-like transposase DDE domain-containing protein n=1 Tax=Hypsibius exemplaris TaxID=2072580 RepID=A0A1W0X805_HYPEX|nr:hypothetical protein BV898_02574 [Hypsibius exemplaris]